MKNYSFFRRLASILFVAIAYFAAAKLGLTLAFVNASATAVWPPTGIALAALLVLGYDVLPGIVLGAFLANLTITGWTVTSLGIAIGNTLEALAGAYLVNRFADGRRAFESVQGVFKFTVLAALLSTLISPTIGVSSLVIGGFARWQESGTIWLTWWTGDAVGDLIVAPALVLWATRRRVDWGRLQVVEAVLLFAAEIFLAFVVFGGFSPLSIRRDPMEFLFVPLLFWAAFRFSPREVATFGIVLAGIALWGTAHGSGPFAVDTANNSLLLLQAFTGILSITGIVLAAAVFERNQLEDGLRAARARLAQQVDVQREMNDNILNALNDMGEGVAITEGVRFIHANDALARLYGYSKDELLAVPHFLDLVDPADRERLADHMRRRLGGETGYLRGETTIVRKDGERVSVEFASKPFAGKIGQTLTIIRDVSERKRAADAVRASEEKFRGLIESAPDAIVIADRQGIIRIANFQAEKLFGYIREELYGQSVEALMPERFHVRHLADRASYFQNPEARVMGAGLELYGRRKDGSEFPADISLSPLNTAEGLLIMTDIRDITERMRIQEALLKTREQAVILQGVSDGITAQGPDGRLIFANQSAAQLLGYSSPQELLATPVAQVVQKFEMMAEDGRPFPVEALPGRLALQGKPLSEAIVRFRIVATGEERWSLVNASPVRDANGQVLFAVNIFHDITERRRSGERILRLAAVVENSEEAIYARGIDGVIQTWNPVAARLLGYSADEAVGLSCAVLFPPDRLEEHSEITERLKRGDSTAVTDTVRLRKDGSRVPVSISVSVIRDGAGRTIGGSVIARDITEHKRAEEAQRFLTEASKALASTLDYEGTLATVARLAVPGIADWCAVDLLTEEENLKRVSVAHVDPAKVKWAYELQERYPPDPDAPTGVYHVLRTGKTEFVPEITEAMIEAAHLDPDRRKLLDELKITSGITAPMIAHGKTLGAITFVSAESGRRYGPADVALAEELANRAALAVDNARLYRAAQLANEELEARVAKRTAELQESNQKLRELTSRLVDSQENERRRIARELHDEFGQVLTGLMLELELGARASVESVRESLLAARGQVSELIAKVRNLSRELRPVTLDDLGLLPALLSLIERYSAQTKIQVDFKQRGLEDQRFASNVETAAYRIVQEALTNVARHARATTASVRVRVEGNAIHIRIEDRGIGFDVRRSSSMGTSSGIAGMRERVLLLGGQFEMDSAPGKGARLTAVIPLSTSQAAQ